MIKYGLIGYPLTHSFSKLFFSEKFKKEKFKNVSYDNFEIKNLDEIKLLIKNNSNLRGLNVTICTNAKTNQEALELLKSFNMPFPATKNN